MQLTPNEAQRRIQELAREVARTELAPKAAELDATGRFPTESFQALAKRGLLGLSSPAELGGLDAGPVALALALTEVAYACPSTAVGMSVTNMVGETLSRFGPAALARKYVPRLTSGEAVAGAFCLSEPGSGSDAAALSATARRDGDHYVLSGTKMWITSGAYAGVLIVMARTSGPETGHRGISAFVVEPTFPGFAVGKAEKKTGLKGSNTVPVVLEDCRVPADNLIGAEGMGFRIAMTALDGGRITIGAMACGIARSALDVAARYAATEQGGALGELASVQHRLADMATALEAAELMVHRAAWMKQQAAETGRRFTREAAMAKLYATEACKRVTGAAVEVCGLDGVTRALAAERAMRDARVTTIFEGTSEIQRLVIAREVLARLGQ